MSFSADIEGLDEFRASMESFMRAVFDDTSLMDIDMALKDTIR